jgi:hypothetical protein
MKKLSLSGFDLGFLIAFGVVTLLGAGAWWYLSGALQDAQAQVAATKAGFDQIATKYDVVVSRANGKTLQANIDVIKAELAPLIHTTLQPKENIIHSTGKEDPVAWKHDLDDKVQRLRAAALANSVNIPPNFYFGFSHYQSQSPNGDQTAVLSKQLLGVEQIAAILIKAPVKGIQAIRRTYEEDSRTSAAGSSDVDYLAGFSLNAPGNDYTAYPFEVDFETSSENLRTVIDKLIQSPYLFVVRTLAIENSIPNSPMINDLDKLAGPPPSPGLETSPGEVPATASVKGPQFLFGNSTLRVKARIDMIEWNTDIAEAPPGAASDGAQKNPPSPGGK